MKKVLYTLTFEAVDKFTLEVFDGLRFPYVLEPIGDDDAKGTMAQTLHFARTVIHLLGILNFGFVGGRRPWP